MPENASNIRDLWVVTRKEGAVLGSISSVQIDEGEKRVSAFVYRTQGRRGPRHFVRTDAVEIVGEDVVIVGSREVGTEVTKDTPPPGRSLKELQGVRVITGDGKHLGTLVDLEVTMDDFRIAELVLAEGKRLPVSTEQLKIADAIIVPADSEKTLVEEESKGGFLERAFGREALEDTRRALQRATSRERTKEEHDGASKYP